MDLQLQPSEALMCCHLMNHFQAMEVLPDLALMRMCSLDIPGEDMPPCLIFRSGIYDMLVAFLNKHMHEVIMQKQ